MSTNVWEVLSSTGAIRTSPASPATLISSSVTGTQNDYAPGVLQNTVEEWSGASNATFTGLSGGVLGYFYTFKNIGTKVANFSHLSGSSSSANQFKNIITSTTTPVAPGGYITYFYDGTNWKIVGHSQGAAITYTPVWTNGTLGNGTLAGNYTVTNLTVAFTLSLVWGSTTSSSGNWTFTLPPFATTITAYLQPGTIIGSGGSGNYLGILFINGSTTLQPYTNASPIATQWGTSQPFVWASTNSMRLESTYLTS